MHSLLTEGIIVNKVEFRARAEAYSTFSLTSSLANRVKDPVCSAELGECDELPLPQPDDLPSAGRLLRAGEEADDHLLHQEVLRPPQPLDGLPSA